MWNCAGTLEMETEAPLGRDSRPFLQSRPARQLQLSEAKPERKLQCAHDILNTTHNINKCININMMNSLNTIINTTNVALNTDGEGSSKTAAGATPILCRYTAMMLSMILWTEPKYFSHIIRPFLLNERMSRSVTDRAKKCNSGIRETGNWIITLFQSMTSLYGNMN